jgi:hypothetical protein
MRRLCLVLALLLATTVAIAAGTSATVSWSYPTAYIDGTPLPVSDIAQVTVTWSRTPGGPQVGSVTVAAPALSKVVPGLVCGNFSFSATVTTTATAAYPTSTSDPAGPVSYATGVSCKPNPLTGLGAS